MSDLKTKLGRLRFYVRGIARDLVPYPVESRRLAQFFRDLDLSAISDDARRRLSYYNRLTAPFDLPGDQFVGNMPLKRSYYYYDAKPLAKLFGRGARLQTLFGDITHVPELPSVLKSRPIRNGSDEASNANSVLLKLETFRHFKRFEADIPFFDKQEKAVWRGGLHNPLRTALVERFAGHPLCNIGHTTRDSNMPGLVETMSLKQQLNYRYVISIEGFDVATNLKWIFSSNSLCMMPKPQYETWFAEGMLEPGVHYVELEPDFSNLEERIEYFNAHPQDAIRIIENANAYLAKFFNHPAERVISILVLQKYFELAGQVERRPELEDLFYGS